MAFFPKTAKEKKRLAYMILLLCYIGLEIRMGAKYAAQRDSDFRAFRWDTRTLWRLKTGYTGEAFGEKIQTGSSGFRTPRDCGVRKTTDFRIVTLGDSRTYGFGVENEETYSAVLQKELRERGRDVEVINAGTHGFSAVQCRAQLERMLKYKPDTVVFAPGYNDRRYIITRAPDSSRSFAIIARLRSFVGVLSWSNMFFGMLCEIGERKIKKIKENSPPLDEVFPRVPENTFREELLRAVSICQDNDIQLVFLLVYQDPSAFGLVEQAARYYDEGDPEEAIETIQEAFNTIPNRSYTESRYYLGLSYQKIGNEKKARDAFAEHRATGSLFGESVLRSERSYFMIFYDVAKAHSIPVIDGRAAIVGDVTDPIEAEAVFREEFVDECHYTAEGHRRMGVALAERIDGLLVQ